MAENQTDKVPRKHTFTNSDASITKSGGKYNISLYQYPSNLHELDLLHYVEFGINVRGKSKYNDNRQEAIRPTSDAKSSPEALARISTVAVAGAGAIAAGAIAKTMTENWTKKITSTGAQLNPKQKLLSKAVPVIAAAGGAIAGAAMTSFSSMLEPDTSYRISDVINLYVDGPPTVKYSMNYANKELGTLAGIVGGTAEESIGAGNRASESLAAATTALAKLPGAFAGVDVQSALSASAKTALNPFKEVIFESVDFRSFAFKYKFMPKNREESKAVKAIIELFKFHMHPEMSDGKLFFIYPAEFQITYYFANGTNDYVHKFAPCVLETMDVTYGGDQYSSFADGTPTEVNMSLVFRETEIITKKMLADDKGGY